MEGDHNRHHFTQAHSRSIEARLLSPHQQGLLAIVIFKGLVEIVYLAENFGNIKMIIHIHGWYLWGVPPQHRFQPLFMPEFSVELTLVLDNARYQKCALVTELAAELGIT
jgi:hypothetical protein